MVSYISPFEKVSVGTGGIVKFSSFGGKLNVASTLFTYIYVHTDMYI